MKKIFVLLLVFSFVKVQSQETASPEVKAVPEVQVAPSADEVDKKVKGSLTGNRPTDIGAIKNEKNCKMVKGELKCKQKKSKSKN